MRSLLAVTLSACVLAACATVSKDLSFGPADPRAMVVLATDALDGEDAVSTHTLWFQAIGPDRQSFGRDELKLSASSVLPGARLPTPPGTDPGLRYFLGWAKSGDHVLVRTENESGSFETVWCHSKGARVFRLQAGRINIVTADRFGRPLESESAALDGARRALDGFGEITAPAALAEPVGEATFVVGKGVFGDPNCYPSGPVSVSGAPRQ
jgi:hypothetical protein